MKPRALSALNPFWPVSATVNTQPAPTVPNADVGNTSVTVPAG